MDVDAEIVEVERAVGYALFELLSRGEGLIDKDGSQTMQNTRAINKKHGATRMLSKIFYARQINISNRQQH